MVCLGVFSVFACMCVCVCVRARAVLPVFVRCVELLLHSPETLGSSRHCGSWHRVRAHEQNEVTELAAKSTQAKTLAARQPLAARVRPDRPWQDAVGGRGLRRGRAAAARVQMLGDTRATGCDMIYSFARPLLVVANAPAPNARRARVVPRRA